MARPCKNVDIMTKHLTKEEYLERKATEEKLKGSNDKIIPPSYFNSRQIDIFTSIVNELKASGILANLDIYILTVCSIAIDRLQTIEQKINENYEELFDKDLMAAKDKYTKDLFRCTNELSLSPQSRAKIGSINLLNKEENQDPLLKVIRGGNDGNNARK